MDTRSTATRSAVEREDHHSSPWLSSEQLEAIDVQLEALEALERESDATVNLLLPAELRSAWRAAELELERVYDLHREALERGRAGEVDEAMREAREALEALEALARRECPGRVQEWRAELALERVEATVQSRKRKPRKARPFAQLELLDKGEPRITRDALAQWDAALEGAPLEALEAWAIVRAWVLANPRGGK